MIKVFHRFLRHTCSKCKKKSSVPGKVQRNAKKVGRQEEEVLQTPNQAGNECSLRAGVSAVSLCVCVCVRVHVCTFNYVLWLEARPKISSSTIVTLMQLGMVATTGPVVNSKEPSIFLYPFLFLLRIPITKQTRKQFFKA